MSQSADHRPYQTPPTLPPHKNELEARVGESRAAAHVRGESVALASVAGGIGGLIGGGLWAALSDRARLLKLSLTTAISALAGGAIASYAWKVEPDRSSDDSYFTTPPQDQGKPSVVAETPKPPLPSPGPQNVAHEVQREGTLDEPARQPERSA